MPAHTGSAIININDDYLYNMMLLNLSKMHSTSPSYISLASMDLARAYFEEHGEEDFLNIKEKIESYNGEFAGFEIKKTADISRLVLRKEGIDCYKVLKDLHDMGFEAEMAYEDEIVFILTPFNIDELDGLYQAMQKLSLEKFNSININRAKKNKEDLQGLKPDFVDLNNAEGLIANADICIYPPSTPIVRFGEKIDREDINILNAHLGHILGLVNNKVPVLK